MKKDHSTATIIWAGPTPPPEIVALVRADIAENLGDLDAPEDREQGTFLAERLDVQPDGLKFDLADFPDLEQQIRKLEDDEDG